MQFTDYLIYTTRVSSNVGFRLHGIIPTSQMEVSGDEAVSGIPFSWMVTVNEGSTNKILVLAAFTQEVSCDNLYDKIETCFRNARLFRLERYMSKSMVLVRFHGNWINGQVGHSVISFQ